MNKTKEITPVCENCNKLDKCFDTGELAKLYDALREFPYDYLSNFFIDKFSCIKYEEKPKDI